MKCDLLRVLQIWRDYRRKKRYRGRYLDFEAMLYQELNNLYKSGEKIRF